MIYFLIGLILIIILNCFTALKGLKLPFRKCAPCIFTYSIILFLLLICVFDNKISLLAFSFMLILSSIIFCFILSPKRLNLYILTLKSYYFFIVSNLLIFNLSEFIFKNNFYVLMEDKFLFIITLVISILVYSIFEGLLFLYFDKEKLQYLLASINSFIPISLLVLLIAKNCCLTYVLAFSRHASLVNIVMLTSTLLEIYFWIFAIVGTSKAYTLSVYKYKNNILNMQYNLQMANLNKLFEYQNDIRKISHDINNHKTVMYKLISDGANDDALKYLQSYGSSFKNKSYEFLTNNKILNAILISKKDICQNNNITIDMDISVPEYFGVSDFDLCIVVGNLMDNAIEACIKIKDSRSIKVKCTILNDNFVFDMKNSFSGDISTSKEGFLTSKNDKLNHGLGISNIESTVDKYNGTCSLSFNDKIFSSLIIIPIN